MGLNSFKRYEKKFLVTMRLLCDKITWGDLLMFLKKEGKYNEKN